MPDQDGVWVVVLNQRRGRIVRIRPVPPGRYRCEEHGSIESSWEEHEHGRPSPRSGREGRTYASRGHEDEEMMRRFAREVSEWLAQSVEHLKIDALTIFTPARFLGELRTRLASRVAKRAQLQEADLVSIGNGDLVSHPAVKPLLGGAG